MSPTISTLLTCLLAAALAFGVSACSDAGDSTGSESPSDGAGTSADGTTPQSAAGAPTITAISADKTALAVGADGTVVLTLSFSDPDGDVELARVQVGRKGGNTEPPLTVAFNGLAGQTQGRALVQLQLNTHEAVDLEVEVWLVDAKRNESPRVTQEINIE